MLIPVNFGADAFYTEEFKTLIRSNKDYLKTLCISNPVTVPSMVYANRYDVYGFLRAMKVENSLLWVTAFLNDFNDPHQDITGTNELLTIDIAVIEKLIRRQNTKR